jgi:hypothetical protein
VGNWLVEWKQYVVAAKTPLLIFRDPTNQTHLVRKMMILEFSDGEGLCVWTMTMVMMKRIFSPDY